MIRIINSYTHPSNLSPGDLIQLGDVVGAVESVTEHEPRWKVDYSYSDDYGDHHDTLWAIENVPTATIVGATYRAWVLTSGSEDEYNPQSICKVTTSQEEAEAWRFSQTWAPAIEETTLHFSNPEYDEDADANEAEAAMMHANEIR